jgi:hypothetical protein
VGMDGRSADPLDRSPDWQRCTRFRLDGFLQQRSSRFALPSLPALTKSYPTASELHRRPVRTLQCCSYGSGLADEEHYGLYPPHLLRIALPQSRLRMGRDCTRMYINSGSFSQRLQIRVKKPLRARAPLLTSLGARSPPSPHLYCCGTTAHTSESASSLCHRS